MKIAKTAFLFALLAAFAVISCKHDAEEFTPDNPDPVAVWRIPATNNCDTGVVYFENQILKLIVTKCAMTRPGCHGVAPFAFGSDGAIDFRTYAGNLLFVDPGAPYNSEIYEKNTKRDPDDRMPPPGIWQLTAEEVELIYDWIAQGALNNRCEPCEDTLYDSFELTISPLLYKNCSGCHNSQVNAGSISFYAYPPVMNNINKTGVEAMCQSILSTLKYSDTNATTSAMPRNIGKLYECEVKKIEKWVDVTLLTL